LAAIFFPRAVGARVDLQICLLGVLFPLCSAPRWGRFGYAGGAVDALMMRIIDIVLAFPFLVLMLAIIAILGPGLGSFYIAMAMVGWVSYARLVRAQVLTLKQRDFILAARSLGYGHPRILFRHLLPNALTGAIFFDVRLRAGAAERGSVSYLGLGVQPPTAEWGVMVAEGQSFITTAWWITTFPGLAIVLLAMGFSLLADGLGDKSERADDSAEGKQ
jgi:peptide/nickel transport system permease protein